MVVGEIDLARIVSSLMRLSPGDRDQLASCVPAPTFALSSAYSPREIICRCRREVLDR